VDINKSFPDGTNLALFVATGLGFTSTGDSETSLSEIEETLLELQKATSQVGAIQEEKIKGERMALENGAYQHFTIELGPSLDSRIHLQILLCKKKILYHIKISAHIWSTECR
jgi:hypothetical protein